MATAPIAPAAPGDPPAGRSSRLEVVEFARGIAASAVVVFHSSAAAPFFGGERIAPFALLAHGVDFFFVLSGFIIFFVHADDIGRPETGRAYLLKRLIRVVPLLWAVVLGYAAMRHLGAGIDASTLISSLFLQPSLSIPSPQVVWTLRHEMLFYAAFLVLILDRRIGLILFGLWTMAALVQLGLALAGTPVRGLASFFLSSYELDFVLGALIAWLHRRRRFRASAWPLVLASALVIGVMVIEHRFWLHREFLTDYVSFAATAWVVVLGAAFAFLLHALLCIEPLVRVPRGFLLLGAASYAIYLVHLPINSVAQRIASHFPRVLVDYGFGHAFLIVCGIAGGIALHFAFEKPVTRLLRRSLIPRRPVAMAH